MSWNPFRKSAKPPAEPEPEKASEPPGDLLPAVNGREDTQRINTTLTELRLVREAAAEQLEETAGEVCEEAEKTTHTLRSMPAFVIPQAAKAAGTK